MLPMCDDDGTACLSTALTDCVALGLYINAALAQKVTPKETKSCAALTHMARCRVVKIIITTCTDAGRLMCWITFSFYIFIRIRSALYLRQTAAGACPRPIYFSTRTDPQVILKRIKHWWCEASGNWPQHFPKKQIKLRTTACRKIHQKNREGCLCCPPEEKNKTICLESV